MFSLHCFLYRFYDFIAIVDAFKNSQLKLIMYITADPIHLFWFLLYTIGIDVIIFYLLGFYDNFNSTLSWKN